jgi:outer membrane protein TolC
MFTNDKHDDLRAQMLGYLAQARDIATHAEKAGRDLTDVERTDVDRHIKRAEELKSRLTEAKANADLRAAVNAQLGGIGGVPGADHIHNGAAYTPPGVKARRGAAASGATRS